MLAVAVVAGACAYVIEAHKPREFVATSSLDYQPTGINLINLVGISAPSNSSNGVTNPQLLTAAAVAVTPDVATDASRLLGGAVSAATVMADTSVTASDTGATLLDVTASNPSPGVAIAVSRAYANAYVTSQIDQVQNTVEEAIRKLDRQIRAASHAGRAVANTTLTGLYERRSELQQVSVLTQPPVTVGLLASGATLGGAHKIRVAAIAAILALIVSLTLAVSFDGARGYVEPEVRRERGATDQIVLRDADAAHGELSSAKDPHVRAQEPDA